MFVAQNLSKKKDKSNSNVVVKIIKKKNEVCNLAMPNMTLEFGLYIYTFKNVITFLLTIHKKKQQEW